MKRKIKQEETLLTPNDLAKRWRVSPGYVRDMVNSGKLTKLPQFKQMKFPISYIEAYEEEAMNCNENDELKKVREINRLKREITRLEMESKEKDEHLKKVVSLINLIQIELSQCGIELN